MYTVSVIMPVYNQDLYIGQAIRSVLNQTFSDFELIIIDDGSTDDTRKKVHSFSDSRIKYIYQDNQERSAARNAGISIASGAYIGFLDADDFWLPTYLERQITVLESNPECGLSRTWVYDTDSQGQKIRVGGNGAANAKSHEEFLQALLIDNCMSSIAVVIRQECLDAVGGFDLQLRQGEDWDLWLRIALRYQVETVDQPLACYRHFNSFMPLREHNRGIEKAFVQVVTKAFNNLEGSHLYTLRNKALGRAYWRAAWTNYALGRIEEGHEFLNQSYQIYPEFFSPPFEEFVERVIYRADALYDLETPLDEGLASIDRLFSNLPCWAHHIRRLRRKTMGRYCGVHIFRSYQFGNRQAIRKAAPLAFILWPRWATNRGLVSIVIKAFLPDYSWLKDRKIRRESMLQRREYVES